MSKDHKNKIVYENGGKILCIIVEGDKRSKNFRRIKISESKWLPKHKITLS